MYKYIYPFCFFCLFWIGLSQVHGQVLETECNSLENLEVASSEVSFNYGSTTNATGFDYRSTHTVGQVVMGRALTPDYQTQFGFWSVFLLPPQAPTVTATRGDFPDRNLISWNLNPLSSSPSDGFVVLRDGAFLASVDSDVQQYIDFNVQAGELYTYAVYGKNQYGRGIEGTSIGFVNPNGVVSGTVRTFSGNLVSGAVVRLSPIVGKSLEFNGTSDNICLSHYDALPTDMLTVSAWIKPDTYTGTTTRQGTILDFGTVNPETAADNYNFSFNAVDGAAYSGISGIFNDGSSSPQDNNVSGELIVTNNEGNQESYDLKDKWSHVAMTYGGGVAILYINGEFIGAKQVDMRTTPSFFSIGSTINGDDFFDGKIDDVRIYNRILSQSEIILTKDLTASKTTEGLVGYWKFDEGIGEKAFDLSVNNNPGLINGSNYSADIPEVATGAITDASGAYVIGGVDYSNTQLFVAEPEKIFYNNYALEFNGALEHSATLTNFDIPDTSHVELTVYPFEKNMKQSILSKMEAGGTAFNFYLQNGDYYLETSSSNVSLGSVGEGYQHIALGLNADADQVKFYLNGSLVSTKTVNGLSGVWDSEAWQLGAIGIDTPTDFYTGLIDEVAFYQDTLLTEAEINLNAASFGGGGTSISHPQLSSYFNLNESEGTEIMDMASAMTGVGEVKGATFSIITRRQDKDPHDFQPESRNVNINSSSTSIPNIDFTDLSTIKIDGVIRFENTFCFQDSVEILVNGATHSSPIFTNANGEFSGDFEPGGNIILTPKYSKDTINEHLYSPGFFETRRLNVPVSGVLFTNTTKREIEGQIYGGLCRKSIIPVNEDGIVNQIIEVELAAQNGCFSRVIRLDNPNGRYKFKNIPPISVTVGIAQYTPSSTIKTELQSAGKVVNLQNIEKDTVDFPYFAPPKVEVGMISDFVGYNCDLETYPEHENVPLINDSQLTRTLKQYTNEVKVYEDYSIGTNGNPKCYLDSFDLVVINGIQESGLQNLHSDTSAYQLSYYANNPNLAPPHVKTMSIVGKVGNKTSDSFTYRTVVLGERQNEATISTSGPSEVLGVVYDPPGDGSYATLSKGTTMCTTWESGTLKSRDGGAGLDVALGGKKTVISPLGTIEDLGVQPGGSLGATFANSTNDTESKEFCVETLKEISTSDGDDIWGSYADVYFGAAMNFKVGSRDVMSFDADSCKFDFSKKLSVEPQGFSTDFVLSEWQILTEILPQLKEIVDGGVQEGVTQEDVDRALGSYNKWLFEIAKKRQGQKDANYDDRNVTFDAAASYTETYTSESSESSSFTTSIGNAAEIGASLEAAALLGGVTTSLSINFSKEVENTSGETEGESLTTSFTFADDDLNDFYSVSIADDLPTYTEDIQPAMVNSIAGVIDDVNNINLGLGVGPGAVLGGSLPALDLATNIVFGLPGETKRFNITDSPFATAPMFRLEGGESMCPWIPGTRNREEVHVTVENAIKTNVSSNNPAVFNVEFGNIGPNGVDGLVYQLGVQLDGNPAGALITIDGTELVGTSGVVPFQFVGTEFIDKQIAVEIGTSEESSFDSLKLYFGSTCQIDHSLSVGYDPGDPNGGFLIYQDYADETNPGVDLYKRFYKKFILAAEFVEPCVPINISFPEQNYVVTPGNEILNVIVNEYDNNNPDLRIVEVEYRPVSGSGAWFDILVVEEDELADNPSPLIAPFDMSELKDGLYEIRAVTDCDGTVGGNLTPGYSEIIRIKKETEAPTLFGAPEPADGFLSTGDEISITFNELINCDKIFRADGIGTDINYNNVALVNTETGHLVSISTQCVDDKIIITPEIEAEFINGKILRATVTDVEDLAGNTMKVALGGPGSIEVNYKSWEFLVDLNPLRWEAGSNIEESMEEGSSLTITRNIVNQNNTPMSYTIEGAQQNSIDGPVTYDNLPSWMVVSPTGGTLDPGEVRPITFTFPSDLVAEAYSSEINVVGSQGDNKIDVDLRVMCKGPEWDLDPTQYTYTMNMTLQLDIEGELSEDNMDRVAAFVVNPDTGIEELRGWAFVQFESSIAPPESPDGTYFAFLTLYSNEFSGEDIKLKIWDVSDCTLYGQVLEEFTYEADGIIGSPLAPQVVHTVNLVARTIPIHQGWNWISYNVDLPNTAINDALGSLTQPQNSLIKNQTDFAVNSSGTFVGSLNELTHRTMYQYRSEAVDSIILTGRPIDPDTVPIDILAGWNWIGYLPQQGMPVSDALNSLTPLNGDIVKSQIAFAQFVAGTGWIGNLNFMSSPNGYLLNISNNGTLTYPRSFTGPAIVENRSSYDSHWQVQAELYQYTMNMIGIVVDERNLIEDGDEVAAFVNGELRGQGQAVYLEGSDSYVIFLTAYANEEGETMDFKFYDRSTDAEIDLMEEFSFATNAIYGAVDAPEIWTPMGVSSTSSLANGNSFEVYPNPANERVYLRFNNEIAERIVVRVTDALGREVERMETQATTGELTLEWMPKDLSEGLYFITLDRADSSVTRKVRITK